MTRQPQPLLRAPPFPGIPAGIAAVSALAPAADTAPADDRRIAEVLASVRRARVGGAFWALPAQGPANTDVRSNPAIDPWSLLAPGVTLEAHGDDEWAAVATIAGAELRLLSPGRFGVSGDTAAERERKVATHLLACRYRDPFTGQPATIEKTLALLVLWRDLIAANRPIAAAAGMAWWKRGEIRRFLWAPRARPLRFASASTAIGEAACQGGGVAVWPSRVDPDTRARTRAQGVPLAEVEDGFIRSSGLGVDLVPPLSVIVDRLGIHYDPSRPSELERLLAEAEFSPALLDRAAALRERVVAGGISKYGSAGDAAFPPRDPARRLVLVPGQVEDDRSVLLGGGEVAGNLDLLRRVRAAEPDAEIWFRPHPDVDAGHRRGAIPDAEALRHVDRAVRGGGMASLLGHVDAVHVLTSLTGFEALLRGREVACHGVPFFAGWGLTRDLAPVPSRRGRRLTLDQLVAATLILYPRYLDPVTMLPCPVEVLVSRLAAGEGRRPGLLVRLRRLQGRLRRPRR